jgi:hypothetical protein
MEVENGENTFKFKVKFLGCIDGQFELKSLLFT